MASYKYEIVGPDGKPKSGTIEAQNIEIATAASVNFPSSAGSLRAC